MFDPILTAFAVISIAVGLTVRPFRRAATVLAGVWFVTATALMVSWSVWDEPKGLWEIPLFYVMASVILLGMLAVAGITYALRERGRKAAAS